MNDQDSAFFDKKGVLRAMFFAILFAFLGIGVLGWQYRQIEKKQLPALEEKIEQKSVEAALEKFMSLRIEKNEIGAEGYLTEGAMEEVNQGEFSLLDDIAKYEILSSEKLSDGQYRYAVKIYEKDGLNDFVEIITLTKISNQYYIDSMVLGG